MLECVKWLSFTHLTCMHVGPKDEMAALEEGFIKDTNTPFPRDEKVQQEDEQKMEENSVREM